MVRSIEKKNQNICHAGALVTVSKTTKLEEHNKV